MTFITVYIGRSGWFPLKRYLSNTFFFLSMQIIVKQSRLQKKEWMVNDEICLDIDYSEYCWLSKIVGEFYDAGKMED